MGNHPKSKIYSRSDLITLQMMYRTDIKIAKQCNVTRQAIQQLRVKWNVPPKFSKYLSLRNQRIQSSKLTPKQLVEKYNLSLTQIYRIKKS